MSYDLIIRNGTVIDGSGRPRFRADIGVTGGYIRKLGRIREAGPVEVDAEGHFVTPGFIDGHTHLDAQVFWDPLGTSACWHGVTSAVMGNCGFTLAPCREEEADLVLRSLERAEDMDREVILKGVKWDWETFPDFLDAVDRLPKGINYSAYIGHSALRAYVMGERAFEGPSTEDDLVAMRMGLEEAIRAGAVGFSTSRTPGHRTVSGGPVASRVATWGEVRSLVSVMGDLGAGIFEISNEIHSDPASHEKYLRQLQDLAVDFGRLVTFTCMFPSKDPWLGRQRLQMLEDTAAAGGDAIAQVHSREFLSVMGFKLQLPYDQLNGWQQFRTQSLEAQRVGLLDPDQRHRLVEEAIVGPYREALSTEIRPPNYEAMRILDSADGGPCRTIAEVAASRGCTPVDVIIDHSLATGFDGLFTQVFGNEDLDVVLAGIRHPHTVVAISDTGAHLTQIIDSSIPTFLLAHWVRREEAFTWEEGVRMLTSDPAKVWGFNDRGLLQEGLSADLVVFDPQTVAPALPTVDADLPGGATRIRQGAVGVRATVVNGSVLFREGEHTGSLPGKLLRSAPRQSR